MPACILAVSVLMALVVALPSGARAADACDEARTLLAAHELDKARDKLVDASAAARDDGCVARVLATIQRDRAAELAACARGAALAKAEDDDGAHRAYVEALRSDV